MKQKGNGIAFTVIIIIVIIIVLLLLFRELFTRKTSDYGTWSDPTTTVCLNEGQSCKVSGKAFKIRTCTPNETTGYG
ncbi:MAG: hypothetical protein ACMG6E_00495, partial [Candidatus Roizmanbacteria bacterium]